MTTGERPPGAMPPEGEGAAESAPAADPSAEQALRAELARAEEALAASEDRIRRELRLVELSRSPVFVWDFDGGIVSWNRGGEELYGYSREEAIGQRKNVMLGTEVPNGSFDDVRRALLERGTWSGELRQRTKDGRDLVVDTRIELFPVGERRLVLESTRDITERKEFERRQEMLLAELTHRVKNTLAVVQSIARLTLRSNRSREDFVASLEGRLAALSEAHRLLVDSNWQGAELGALARGQLAAYAIGASDRVQVEGEPLLLPPRLATPFALVFHELATNAAKYGALSEPSGRIELSWKVESREGARWLTVRWREHGGPRPRPPEGPGSGTQLIRRGVPGATVHFEFPTDGAECTIELELEDESEGAPAG